MNKRSIVGLLPLLALIGAAPAAYDPRETFAPFDMKSAVNIYRGESGLPGRNTRRPPLEIGQGRWPQ